MQAPAPDERLDHEAVLRRVDDNLLLLQEIIDMFCEDCPQWLTAIRESIAQADGRRLQRTAHTLRGAVSYFGAEATQTTVRVLEQMGRAGDFTAAPEAFLLLEAAIERLQPALLQLAAGVSERRFTFHET